jgi:hypothetical protein
MIVVKFEDDAMTFEFRHSDYYSDGIVKWLLWGERLPHENSAPPRLAFLGTST